MENITILECNRKNAVVGTNSSFVNTFQQPVRVNPGDVVSIKTAIIDSTQSTGNDIVLEDDVNIELELGYYYVNGKYPTNTHMGSVHIGRTYYNGGGTTGEHMDWRSYIARNPTTRSCIRGTFTHTISAGSYTAGELAELLTRAMTKVQSPPYANSQTETILGDPNPFNPVSVYNGEYPKFYEHGGANIGGTQGRSFTFLENYTSFYGASQVALTWDNENNGRFSFDWLHTPLLFKGAPAVLIDKGATGSGGFDTGGKMAIQNRRSGVFFFKMEPKSFWEGNLGFEVSSMILTEGTDGKLNYDIDDTQGTRSTGAFIGLVDLVCDPQIHEDGKSDNKGTQQGTTLARYDTFGDPAPGYNYSSTSDKTQPMQAKKTYDPTASGGYYLLSISGLRGDYHTDASIRSDIQAIISRQYVQQGYITAFADSGVPWINTGPAFDISNLKIEILDPGTGKPATDIDENTAIFLQIARRGKINT